MRENKLRDSTRKIFLLHASGAKPSPISFRTCAMELIVFEGPLLRRPFGKRYLKANEEEGHWIGGHGYIVRRKDMLPKD